jgi:hypothetical protein
VKRIGIFGDDGVVDMPPAYRNGFLCDGIADGARMDGDTKWESTLSTTRRITRMDYDDIVCQQCEMNIGWLPRAHGWVCVQCGAVLLFPIELEPPLLELAR